MPVAGTLGFGKQEEPLSRPLSADNIAPFCNYTYISKIVEGFYL